MTPAENLIIAGLRLSLQFAAANAQKAQVKPELMQAIVEWDVRRQKLETLDNFSPEDTGKSKKSGKAAE